jgi:hypothetical protein
VEGEVRARESCGVQYSGVRDTCYVLQHYSNIICYFGGKNMSLKALTSYVPLTVGFGK